MAITIDGTGSISGISAGGLPDASVTANDLASNAVTTAKIADANITAAKLNGAQSGSAPIYGARAWVNFNGTSTVAIRASGNVSSITDNGTGSYAVNFTTAMPDANYCYTYGGKPSIDSIAAYKTDYNQTNTTTVLNIVTGTQTAAQDFTDVCAAVFR